MYGPLTRRIISISSLAEAEYYIIHNRGYCTIPIQITGLAPRILDKRVEKVFKVHYIVGKRYTSDGKLQLFPAAALTYNKVRLCQILTSWSKNECKEVTVNLKQAVFIAPTKYTSRPFELRIKVKDKYIWAKVR